MRRLNFRESCGSVRGMSLTQTFDKKNKPVWTVA